MRISDWSSDVCSSDLGDGRSARSAALADLRHEAVDIRLVVHIVHAGTHHRLEPAAREADAAAGAGGGADVDALGDAAIADFNREIGRASCRKSVCLDV